MFCSGASANVANANDENLVKQGNLPGNSTLAVMVQLERLKFCSSSMALL